MRTILTWPRQLPTGLDGLHAALAAQLDDVDLRPLAALDEVAAAVADTTGEGSRPALVAVPDAAVSGGQADVAGVLAGLQAVADVGDLDLAVVVSDAYLGTDVDDLAAAALGAAVVAAVRSIAVRRGGHRLANVVAVPAAMLGTAGTQRGPLRQAVDMTDVANALGFLLGETGGYLNGQVLFVDGGRHLFSSLTA